MKAKTTFKVLGFILAVAIVLFGGIGLTGVAAQSAIPGDALYPVKTTIENTRLSLAQDAGDRAQMKLAFAELRLSEITGLVREGRYREIREAVLAFEANINAAIMELETVSAADPARAAVITQEVTSALTRYAQTLSELAVIAPDSIKPEVNRALDTTQIASGLGQINGNENANDNVGVNDNANGAVEDNSNGNANDNSNDNVSDDNGNDNTNNNSNVDDNSNSNENSAVEDHSNGNANDNSDDDNSNANVNANDNDSVDDNSNSGLDDNGNSNDNSSIDDNSNDNGSDDSSGRVSGSDDNGNDNGGSSGSGGSDDGGSSGKGGGKDD